MRYSNIVMKLSLDLRDACWGDLRDYIEACANIPDAAPLGVRVDSETGSAVLEEEHLRRIRGGGAA